MTRKELMERQDELKHSMLALLDQAEMETRNLSDTENDLYQELENELRSISEQLNTQQKNLFEIKGETNMETRNYAEELLTGKTLELRAMNTTNHSEAVPTNLYDEITRKMKEKSDIVAEIRTVESQGDMEFLIENEVGEAKFLSETETCTPTDLSNFDKVKLTDKRVGTSVLVSKKLLNNSPAFTTGYLADIVSERMANALEKELLSIVTSEKGLTNTLINDTEEVTGTLTIDTIMTLITSMKTSYLSGAKLIMNRATFMKVSALKDNTGRFYVVPGYDHATGTPVYSVLGMNIRISEYAPADKIILANVSQAGIMKQSGGLVLTPLVEKYAENAQIAIVANQMCDFGILNKECVKVLTIQNSRAKAA